MNRSEIEEKFLKDSEAGEEMVVLVFRRRNFSSPEYFMTDKESESEPEVDLWNDFVKWLDDEDRRNQMEFEVGTLIGDSLFDFFRRERGYL